MENSFFCQWFKGFEKGLDEVDLDSRSCLLKQCAKHCADTGVLQSYLKLYQTVNGERDAFYSRLSELGNTPNLCECSRQSIIYVGESVWGDSKIRVEQVETILSGDAECKFRVIFDENR